MLELTASVMTSTPFARWCSISGVKWNQVFKTNKHCRSFNDNVGVCKVRDISEDVIDDLHSMKTLSDAERLKAERQYGCVTGEVIFRLESYT